MEKDFDKSEWCRKGEEFTLQIHFNFHYDFYSYTPKSFAIFLIKFQILQLRFLIKYYIMALSCLTRALALAIKESAVS